MAISTSALVLSFLYFTIPALSLYSPSGAVPLLNPKTFDQKIRNSKHASIVEFFAPWCGHCKNLAPAYTKAAEHMAGIFTFAAVDCDDQTNRALCAELDIQGFPTIKFMKPFHGSVDAQDYNGPRTAKGLTDFAKENMQNLVVRVTDEKLPFFLQKNNDTAKAIMFSNKGTTSALWKSLAIEFQEQIIVAQARDTQKAVVKEFNVDKYPTLVVLPGGSAPGIVYSGAMERDPIYKFLFEYAPVAKLQEPPMKEPPVKQKQEPLVDSTPKKITEVSELWTTCYETHGTCYLLLSTDEAHINTLAAIKQRLRATKAPMRIYSTELFAGKESLFDDNAIPALIAVNGGKGWYKKFEGTIVEKEVSAWMDAVKMGEGKKFPLPLEKSKELFGIVDFSEAPKAASSSESSTTETSTTTATEASPSPSSEEGIKEVFGDDEEKVHDEL